MNKRLLYLLFYTEPLVIDHQLPLLDVFDKFTLSLKSSCLLRADTTFINTITPITSISNYCFCLVIHFFRSIKYSTDSYKLIHIFNKVRKRQ